MTLFKSSADIAISPNISSSTLTVGASSHIISKASSYIKYTLDGSDPKNGKYYYQSGGSKEYTDDIDLTEPGTYTFRAIAYKDGIYSEEINTEIVVEQLSEPEITLKTQGGVQKAVMSADKKADIYYTTDGSKPTTDSELYTVPPVIDEDCTIRAIAVREGYVSSEISDLDVEMFDIEKPEEHYYSESKDDNDDDDDGADEEPEDPELTYEPWWHDDADDYYDDDSDDDGDDDDEYYDDDSDDDGDDDSDDDDYYDYDEEIECPHCGEIFTESTGVYDDIGYLHCPYCDDYVLLEVEYYEDQYDDYDDISQGKVLTVYSDLSIYINGSRVYFPDARPFIDSANRTQVPVRFVAEELGFMVNWYGSSKTVSIATGGGIREIYMKIGSPTIHISGAEDWEYFEKDVTMDTTAMIKNDRTYIPLRYVAEALGYTVEWEK